MVSKKKVTTSLSAMDVLLGKDGQTRSIPLVLSEHYPTVLSVARSDVTGLLNNNPGLHITQARELLQRAQAMSVVTARQFREQRLTASVREANRPPTGIKGLVEGPTYTDMFNPDWANHCPPDAIEATTSPVAYLADLYRYAKELEATGKPGEVITLDARRPDLKDLMLDHTALNRVEPTIVLVNEILETSIRSHLDGIALEDKTVDDALLEARYPNALPFERYTSQINYVLGRKGYSLGDVIRLADPAYPYFKEPGVHSALSDTALIQDTGFGPVQQALLLEAPYFPDADGQTRSLIANKWRVDPRTRLLVEAGESDVEFQPSTFFQDNFGVGGSIGLEDTQTFCLRTGLKTEELEALLSVGAFASGASPNVTAIAGGEADGSLAGSVYINAGRAPAMAIETLPGTSADGILIEGPRHRIINASPDRFDRMNRMIRLARWLDLPFDEVDQLLVASMQAERRAASVTRRVSAGAGSSTYVISQNTLRALGLFQNLRKNYQVKAADFAALLYGVGVYTHGKTESQFDQIFNSQALFSIPLMMDDTPFVITPKTDAERQKTDHLCAALGMTFETYRYVAKVVEQTYGGEGLTWSREVISAFYRLVKLPRYIGLSTVEALALLELLNGGGSQLVAKLAGVTQIASYNALANTDTLSVMHALADCSNWLKENKWTVAQLCRLLLPSVTQPVGTEAEFNLLQQIHTRLGSSLITDSSFAETGAPDVLVMLKADVTDREVYVSEPINWFEELNSFIDAGMTSSATKGLVRHLSGETEEMFEATLSNQVEATLHNHDLPVENLHAKITNMIMRARGTQEALLMEGLGGYLNISADLAKALLLWVGGNRYQLLKEVTRVYGSYSSATIAIGDEVLLMLETLSKRATLSTHLALSTALILQYVDHPDWFGRPSADLTMQSVYLLTQYATNLRLSEQSEDNLLNYLGLIHRVWPEATAGDKRLIRDSAADKLSGFLRWGVRDVLAVAHHLNPDEDVIFTFAEFNVLAAVCVLCENTGLDAKASLVLHTLIPTSTVESYRQAAEMALSCLTEPMLGGLVGEVGQSHTSTITVSPDYLVANRPADVATYIITLRDFMDQPLDGVTIRWSTSLGELDSGDPVTDGDGQNSIRLRSGALMGLAKVVASYGLGEIILAPTVIIDCDESSLQFINPSREPSEAQANKLEVVKFSVELIDDFGNSGVDRVLEWGTTLGEFSRYQTWTDQSGVGVAALQSGPKGSASVVVTYFNGKSIEFQPVEFISQPYFQLVEFSSSVVVQIDAPVICRLVESDGGPVESGAIVSWSSDVDGLLVDTSETDVGGFAYSCFRASAPGKLVITVESNISQKGKSTAVTNIYPPMTVLSSESSSVIYILGSSDSVSFKVVLAGGGDSPAGIPVNWSIDGGSSIVRKTDNQGFAQFDSIFTEGKHLVSAKVPGVEEAVNFYVTGVPYFNYVAELRGRYTDVDSQDCPGLLSASSQYQLNVKLVDGSGKLVIGVPFRLQSVGTDPRLVGVIIDDLDKVIESTGEGHDFFIASRGSTSYMGDIKLRLGFFPITFDIDYKVGFIYRAYVYLNTKNNNFPIDMYIGNYSCGNDVQYNFPSPPHHFTESGLLFSVPSKGWSAHVSLYWRYEPFWEFPIESEGGPVVGDLCSVTKFFTNNGYVYYTIVSNEDGGMIREL
jgi:hypothetical protein